jgi:hypothetical protein
MDCTRMACAFDSKRTVRSLTASRTARSRRSRAFLDLSPAPLRVHSMVGRAGRDCAQELRSVVATGCELCRKCHGGSRAMLPVNLVRLTMMLRDAAPAMTGSLSGVFHAIMVGCGCQWLEVEADCVQGISTKPRQLHYSALLEVSPVHPSPCPKKSRWS